MIDFNVNATGTLNLLELTKKYCPEAPFIFMSTKKRLYLFIKSPDISFFLKIIYTYYFYEEKKQKSKCSNFNYW